MFAKDSYSAAWLEVRLATQPNKQARMIYLGNHHGYCHFNGVIHVIDSVLLPK